MSDALSSRLFLSAVTPGFGPYRTSPAAALRRTQRIEVKVQDDFGNDGKSLFDHLDDYIQQCAGRIPGCKRRATATPGTPAHAGRALSRPGWGS